MKSVTHVRGDFGEPRSNSYWCGSQSADTRLIIVVNPLAMQKIHSHEQGNCLEEKRFKGNALIPIDKVILYQQVRRVTEKLTFGSECEHTESKAQDG